ncbi:Alpha-1,4 glucan phosphorylase [Heracleum sosnowskyi]|uniref:Alpha-1,4 glucan phosphorylase n=1 Tax=Heracleum sosnowskyi TaxID=360622 RepID=A0AAD8IFE8_9APIA|nr:Alpha-1,4 glucan phosphorylase [Heracleum sosnowskyi]
MFLSIYWHVKCQHSTPIYCQLQIYAQHHRTYHPAGIAQLVLALSHLLWRLLKLKPNGAAKSDVPAKKIPAVANPLAEKPLDIASNISNHAQYSPPHFSPFKFEPEQAYYAAAESVRDRLVQQWNETYLHYHKVDPKQTYYLSMEFLQGRALTNAIGNLDIQDAYAEALNKLGHELEEIVEQEKDAALGNGGLGRLASCFLDSMEKLSLPARGYGLRYRYGLFKQRITKAGQEETAEDWLEKFSPWEVIKHDVVFPVRFFGHVEVQPDGSRKWAGGEYEATAQLHSRAQQICDCITSGHNFQIQGEKRWICATMVRVP